MACARTAEQSTVVEGEDGGATPGATTEASCGRRATGVGTVAVAVA